MNGTLCIFAKPPVAGKAKTRLVPALGTEGAARLAEAFLRDTWDLACRIPQATPIIASTDVDLTIALTPTPTIWLQGQGDLGQRLERIFRRGLERGGFVIALGADSPGLPVQRLQQAVAALARTDAVLGPCSDGGYYLFGLTRCPAGLLAGLPWSSAQTLAETLARLREWNFKPTLLDPWFDVDTPIDLIRLRELIREQALDAPATRAVLAELCEPTPGEG